MSDPQNAARLTTARARPLLDHFDLIRLGDNPLTGAEKLAAEWGAFSAEQLLDTPFVLIARDPSQAAEILLQRHAEFGFDSFTPHEPSLGALGQVIAAAGLATMNG